MLGAGLRPAHHRFPQLVPDGLCAEEHLQEALKMEHPCRTAFPSTVHVQNAFAWAAGYESINESSQKVCEILRAIASETREDDEDILKNVPPTSARFWRPMREQIGKRLKDASGALN